LSSRDSVRRFHFIREIASGGFGSVYLAKVMHADGFSRLVAVKLLKNQWSDSEEVARRMRDEARLLGLLRHRNIVDVIDLTSIDGRAAVIMEYLEGVDLRFVVKELVEVGDALPVRSALEMMAAAASALDAAYNRPPIPGDKPLRVIHRDIKPSNIMIDESGLVKVLDFGVARSDIEGRESQTQDLQFGSLEYMAPERLFFEPETPAGDVYALGATLFELLAQDRLGKAKGRPDKHAAFLSERFAALRGKVGLKGGALSELEALLRASLDFEHEKRPTAAEMYQRCKGLARLVDDEDLGSWAERALAPIIQKLGQEARPTAAFTDTVLTEDSVFFRPDELAALESASAPPVARERVDIPPVKFEPLIDITDPSVKAVPSNPANPPNRPAGPSLMPQTGAPRPSAPRPNPTLIPDADEMPTVAKPPEGLPSFLSGPAPVVGDTEAPTEIMSAEQEGELRRAQVQRNEGRVLGKVEPQRIARPEPPAIKAAPVREEGPPPRVASTAPPVSPVASAPVAVAPPVSPVASAPPVSPVAISAGKASAAAPAPAPAPAKKSMAGMVAMAGCLGLGLGTVIFGLGGWFAYQQGLFGEVGAAAPVEVAAPAAEVPPVEEAAPEAAPAPEAAAAPAGGLRFTSVDPQTKKLKVVCGAVEGTGGASADVAAASAESCTVEAILHDRSRRKAKVEGLTAGAYRCFDGAEDRCVRE
jgi:serine/threonine protein kinase